MSNYINNCPKCHYTARLHVFAGEIGVRAVKCDKCGHMGEKKQGSKEAIKSWNNQKIVCIS